MPPIHEKGKLAVRRGRKTTGLLLCGGSRVTERIIIGKKRKAFGEGIVRTYERFLELPVVVVLIVMWLAGALLLGTCALLLYLYGLSLVRVLTG